MIDLKQAILDQRDLTSLCSPRPQRMPEAYAPNANYGFASVLKAYSGYPAERPLPVVIPHGVYFDEDAVFPGEAGAPVPAVFSYPEYRDRPWRRRTPKKVVPGASPFLYALAMMQPLEPPERNGTIYFPAHSTAMVDSGSDWERLASALDGLDERFRPVTVCIHWQDFQYGRHVPFQEHGYRVVSAGHVTDAEFLFRLIHLMSVHRFAASNEAASNLFYAISMGMPYLLVGDEPHWKVRADTPHRQLFKSSASGVRRRLEVRELFVEPSEEITPEQRACADYYLRADKFRRPEDLLTDLLFAARVA